MRISRSISLIKFSTAATFPKVFRVFSHFCQCTVRAALRKLEPKPTKLPRDIVVASKAPSALLPLLYSFHLPYGTSGPSPGKSRNRKIGLRRERNSRIPPSLTSAVRTAWPATRPAHSFLKFRAYPLDVLPSSFRFLDRDNPANPLIACQWRNILPFCPCHRVRNENLSQIRWYAVYRARRERFPGHGFHSISLRNQSGDSSDAVRIGPPRKANLNKYGSARFSLVR